MKRATRGKERIRGGKKEKEKENENREMREASVEMQIRAAGPGQLDACAGLWFWVTRTQPPYLTTPWGK